MAAGGASGTTDATTTSTSAAPAASSPADLDRRVEELEKELVELRSELAARKQTEEAKAVAKDPIRAAANTGDNLQQLGRGMTDPGKLSTEGTSEPSCC